MTFSNSFRDIKKNHFVRAAAEAASPDIDDSIKQKRIRVSLKTVENEASDGFVSVAWRSAWPNQLVGFLFFIVSAIKK